MFEIISTDVKCRYILVLSFCLFWKKLSIYRNFLLYFSTKLKIMYPKSRTAFIVYVGKSIVPNISHHFVSGVCATCGRSTYVALLCVRRLSNWFKIYYISLNYDLVFNRCCATLWTRRIEHKSLVALGKTLSIAFVSPPSSSLPIRMSMHCTLLSKRAFT
jgi:hypothetical protein